VRGKSKQEFFFNLMLLKFEQGEFQQAFVLAKLDLSKKWCHSILQHPHCILANSLAFSTPLNMNNSNTTVHSYAVVYLGPNIDKFCAVFKEFGFIPGVSSWSFVRQQPMEVDTGRNAKD